MAGPTVHPNMLRFLADLADVVEKHTTPLFDTYGEFLALNVELDGTKYATYYEEGWQFV